MHVHRPRLQQLLADHFAQHRLDALIFPTTPFPAVAVTNDMADIVIDGRRLPQGFGYLIQNTVYQSASGIPSLTVPAGLTADGLPVGLNFDGPMGTDRRLLAIGLAFEELRGAFPAPPRCAGTSVIGGSVA
jgi:mandelamide amidase